VGKGLATVLASGSAELASHGLRVKVVAAVDSKTAALDDEGLDIRRIVRRKKETGMVGEERKSAREIIREVDADVVVELTPGNPGNAEPGLTHIREALKTGKSVITANKMPLALHYGELTDEARRRRAQLLYSACVGSGLPILELGEVCARTEPVDSIDAVLNATSNFIISKMEEGGITFESALKQAQRRGYAETDPSLDVDGIDAAAKIVILSNHVLKTRRSMKGMRKIEGIRKVSPRMVGEARKKGKVFRMVARAGNSLQVRLSELQWSDPLSVKGTSVSAVFHCRHSGERTITGPGAGSVTASRAILRDLIRLGEGIRA